MTTKQNNAPAVNFYILADSDEKKRLNFIYRLVDKAYQQQLPTLIITADNEQLKQLDKLIWTAQPNRFIPHEVISHTLTKPLPPILLTDNNNLPEALDFEPQIVIDLSYDATPLNYPKIMLIANQTNDILANARMKYQAYVNQGIKPTVYKL